MEPGRGASNGEPPAVLAAGAAMGSGAAVAGIGAVPIAPPVETSGGGTLIPVDPHTPQ